MATEVSGKVEAMNSGTAIEIKIKTMDSQTYTLQVDKQMPVPALKECVASVTGIVTAHQRLICRGKVLKDDELLSAYHVEDGHTLHLVVQEPTTSSSQQNPADSVFDNPSSGNRGQVYQVAPGIVVETFNLSGQTDRGLPDVNQIVSAVLGSMGITTTGITSEMRVQAGDRQEDPGSAAADTAQISPEQSGMRNSNDRPGLQNAFGIPAGISFGSGQAAVIPDAVATLSQYLSNMRQEFLNGGNVEENIDGTSSVQGNGGASSSSAQSGNALPTPASLAELLSATRQMLSQLTEESLLQLARQLENQENMTDSVERANAQSGALRSGILLQNVGAYFLELGRTVSTLRFGQSPSEAVVNAGPAVFISPSGPNPLMVQPYPFPHRASFGTPPSENLQSGPGLTNSLGAGYLPRRIIQIRRAAPTQPTEPAGPQQPSGQRHSSPVVIGVTQSIQPTAGTSDPPSSNSGADVREPLFRTMMGAASDVNQSPQPGSLGFLHQLLGRSPTLAAGNLSSRAESQGPGDLRTPESTSVQQSVEVSAANGNQTARTSVSSAAPRERVASRTIEIDILSSGVPSDLNVEGLSPGILQYLRGLFPGSAFHIESVSSEDMPTATGATEQAPPSGTVAGEAEARATEEGLFFSRMLQQLMPLISQDPDIEQAEHSGDGDTEMHRDDTSSSTPAEGSETRSSQRRGDQDPDLPDSKRQKME